jgi:hypothetical protein
MTLTPELSHRRTARPLQQRRLVRRFHDVQRFRSAIREGFEAKRRLKAEGHRTTQRRKAEGKISFGRVPFHEKVLALKKEEGRDIQNLEGLKGQRWGQAVTEIC